MRLAEGDKVVLATVLRDEESLFLASQSGHVIHFPLSEVNVLSGAGKGVMGMKLGKGEKARRDFEAALRIEAFHRFEQTDQRHLQQVVVALSASPETTRDGFRESDVHLDQAVAKVAIVGAAVLREELGPLSSLVGGAGHLSAGASA